MEKTPIRALYAYFGKLGAFTENIPGHTFYQVGLLDSISEKFSIDKFDFLNYIDNPLELKLDRPIFPDVELGKVFESHSDRLLDQYLIDFDDVLENIRNRVYSKLFLKARFRNLSTLEKKLKDARQFEMIIDLAIEVGYSPSDIVILDTDLSLSQEFLDHINLLGLSHEIPSVTFPGIGQRFLASCLEVHRQATTKRGPNLLYYGNLAFDNYKEGHTKNPIINEIIEVATQVRMFNRTKFNMTVAAKSTPELTLWLTTCGVKFHPRENRMHIWQEFERSLVSVNVSKDLYVERKFIPARVYESVIFGVIPVSYKCGQHPAMTFDTVQDFFEICKFLTECSPADYFKILSKIAESL
jgi:hypothetical protein